MKKPSLKERFSYWFDKKMSGGSLSLIKLLAIVSLAIVLIVAFLIFIFGLNEEGGFRSAFWNSLATIINAWMPYFEEGGPGYLILTAVAAVAGLFITSILIGIIASAIEEKVNSLKRGTSNVLEEGHIVVLGFYPGEYTLVRELVLAAADGGPRCIVVVSDMEQEELEESIRENIDIPKNVRIICRTLDMFDPSALEKCSVAGSSAVIVSPTDDARTFKALLSAASVLSKAGGSDTRMCAIVSDGDYVFPESAAGKYGITTLRSGETLAKIIAHSCTQPGLADTFRELFRFEGSELYANAVSGAAGLRFGDLLLRMDGGVPIGILRGGEPMINISRNVVLEEGDLILFFSENAESAVITDAPGMAESDTERIAEGSAPDEAIAIIGGNDSIRTVLAELPENVKKVTIAPGAAEIGGDVLRMAEARGVSVSFFDGDLHDPASLERLAGAASHIVLLTSDGADDDEADMESILLLMKLRDIRARLGLDFNITAEMKREYNQKLVPSDNGTDFLVASNMSSLVLAQLAESPELVSSYSELLSNRGNELYLKKCSQLLCAGVNKVSELRRLAMLCGYIMIGYRKADDGESIFNPALGETLELSGDDCLIVIGES